MTANHSFQTGGFPAPIGELRKQMEREIIPLREQLKTLTDQHAREELKEKIRKITGEFKQQERQSGYSLFKRH